MYNIWCEVKKLNVVLVFLGICFSIGSFFIDSKYDYTILIVTLLLIVVLLKSIFKYLSLKKNGTLIQNIPYEFKQINDKEKVLIIKYQLNNENYIQLFKRKLNWGNVSSNGTTNVLIDLNNPKKYFIFDPNIN